VDADGAVRRVKLHNYARGLPAWGCKTVDIPAREKQPAHTAKLVLSAAAITLIPPRRERGEHRRAPLPSLVIIAREVDAPAGVEPGEWILLSDLEVRTLEDVVRDLHWYGGRWTVEISRPHYDRNDTLYQPGRSAYRRGVGAVGTGTVVSQAA